MRKTLLALAVWTATFAAAQESGIADVSVKTHEQGDARFYTDLVKGRRVAINFIFTSCTTVCPLMGVRFAQLQPLLPPDVSLISVSIDPANDTPEKLAAFASKVGAKPGWTLITGAKPEIDTLLQSLGSNVADPASHTPLILVVDDRGAKPKVERVDGLTDPKVLAKMFEAPSAKYFGGLDLVDQDGHATDLYSLMKGRTIVMHSFFASCAGSCPVMTRTLNAIQDRFADRLGKDLVLVSLTVDPKNDTPAKLKSYAEDTKAGAGRYFLTGTKEQVDAALKRIGQSTESPEQHANLIIVGNERTGLWKKTFGLAKSEEIVEIVRGVLEDR
jgi:protein SCO1